MVDSGRDTFIVWSNYMHFFFKNAVLNSNFQKWIFILFLLFTHYFYNKYVVYSCKQFINWLFLKAVHGLIFNKSDSNWKTSNEYWFIYIHVPSNQTFLQWI